MALIGVSEPGSAVTAYADAGATWWLEHLHGRRGSIDQLVARIRSGPPDQP